MFMNMTEKRAWLYDALFVLVLLLAGWLRLAHDEGYQTVEAYEATLRRLHYGAFLRGEKPMWLHEIRPAKPEAV